MDSAPHQGRGSWEAKQAALVKLGIFQQAESRQGRQLAPLPDSPRCPSAGLGGDRAGTPAPARQSQPQRPERGGGAATRGLE